MQHENYDIAAYIWPAYTGDEPRTRIFWPEGFGEWETVQKAKPKFEGHQWPRKPVWGYVNEADPYVMEMEINAAADHGVNTFIYDWYWFDGQPFLEQCLDNGFLKARNNRRMKFYLMWANHDVHATWDIRNAHKSRTQLWSGRVTAEEFRKLCDRWIAYFQHPSYYRINGKPVLMIYYLWNFILGVGGMDEAKRCLDYLQERAVQAGLPGVHLQVVQMRTYDDGSVIGTDAETLKALRIDSTTHYQIASCTNPDHGYRKVLEEAEAVWEKIRSSGIPYYPHVSIGWDNNPRFQPLMPHIMTENTPENFELALRKAKAYADAYNETPLITLNSWNEWTEGSYLEPDDLYGYGYLEAVRRVFGTRN